MKFSFVNKINIILFKDNSLVLEALILVEEMLITWYYVILLIFNFLLNRALLLITYQRIYSSVVVFI